MALVGAGKIFFKNLFATRRLRIMMSSTKKRERRPISSATKGASSPKKAATNNDAIKIKRRKDASLIFADFDEFRPRLLPRQIFEKGGFGGGYFRKIQSGVTGKSYTDAADEFDDQLHGIPKKLLSSSVYDKSVNRFGVKAGSDLEAWESKAWIKAQDPYGWVQWYCRFVAGRRSDDDARQVQRWLNFTGPKGRFRNNLINQVNKAGAKFDDPTISPVIRQGLHHWGYELRAEDL